MTEKQILAIAIGTALSISLGTTFGVVLTILLLVFPSDQQLEHHSE
jgi:hypothetical protein